MKLVDVDCPICETADNYRVLYKKNFNPSDLNTKTFSARRIPDKIHYQLVRCNKCGLVRSNPVAKSNILNKLYKKSFFTYEEEIDNLTDTYISSVLPILKTLPKKARILEVGCGNGFMLNKIHKLGYTNVFGIEPSIDAVRKADKRIKNNIKISILKRGLFYPARFDLIFFFQTFDHIPNPNTFLSVCYSLLKPKKYILSFNHNVDSFSSKFFGEKSPIIDIEHTFLYDAHTMQGILQKNNFKVIKSYSPWSTVSLKHLLWLMPFPTSVKQYILNTKHRFLDRNIYIKLGNICVTAQKI